MREYSGPAVRMAALAFLTFAAGAAPQGQAAADLLATAKPAGEVAVFVNEHVRVRHERLEYPAAERAVAEARPVVLYVKVRPESGPESTTLLDAPRGGRLSWRSGAAPLGVVVEILKRPPAVSSLRDPEADPPRGTVEQLRWEGGRLLVTVFEPMHYGEGSGAFASVTAFLSDGWVEVANRGVRRRFGVRAGDAFWFEARTRITILSDDPVGAAIAQIEAR